MPLQAPHSLLMIRPAAFGSNPETMESNTFQHPQDLSAEEIQRQASFEFDRMVEKLQAHDIQVLVVDDTEIPVKPDAIFPNNWVSMQPDGKLVTYPMLAENRRLERRGDIIAKIKEGFGVSEELDFTEFELQGKITEGTGSLIFDHDNKIAYAARSPRTDESMVIEICRKLGYKPVIFNATDEAGNPVYHTNVMMAVATEFALVSLDAIGSEDDRERVLDSLNDTGHKIISISFEQMKSFAGNVLEVLNSAGDRVLIISDAAVQVLLPGQLDAITRFIDILPISIPTIEKYSGGSVRCMMAGIHLPVKG